MTEAQAYRLYLLAGCPDEFAPGDSERKEIHRAIEEIIAARTDRNAGRVVDWWGCWDRKLSATAFARRVRALAEKGDKA